MSFSKKIFQLFLLLFLSFAVASCDEGCVELDEFDTESVRVESNPTTDGVYGFYEPTDGGQRADWHDTGLKSNGEEFLIQISGAWTPWFGTDTNDGILANLPRCNFCAKKSSAPNCICYSDETPAPEIGIGGLPLSVDCSVTANMDDPLQCTCTNNPIYGSALDYGAYHIPLNYSDKNEVPLIADRQSTCKYDRGMGAYIGLFGARGTDVPLRVYHLLSLEETCNIVRDSQGRCIASNGQDVTRYVFESANQRIFVKDDQAGNDGTDTNTSDDIYHKPNEVVKVIIFDRYYSDNYGGYNLTFLKGVGNAKDNGLLEFLVRMVEDVLLGDVDDNGQRQGGIIEFMYKALVQDSGFIVLLQIALSLYIAFYGIAHLFGLADINRKELVTRVLKIGLVVFFTSKDSWMFYKDIVISFFKDSMDYVVSGIMSMSDSNIDESSMIKIAQLDRASDISNATRFSYVDLIIKKLFANATSKKIFGLFFGTGFGILYIPIIYSLIAYFVYVMLFIASVYLINLIKIIFVLSLGPIFICFSLFSQTQDMFKNWVGYLGARSLEILILFLVLYNFLMLIDKNFTDLLSYRACLEHWGIGPLQLKILKSYPDRSFISWIVSFFVIGGLLFITNIIINKVAELAGSLIKIGGIGGGTDYGSYDEKKGIATGATGILGQGLSAFKSALGGAYSFGTSGGRYALQGLTAAARSSGIADSWNKLGDKIGVRGIRTRLRDSIIDAQLDKFSAEARAAGKTGHAADSYARGKAFEALTKEMQKDPNKMALYGVDNTNILKRFDQKLVGNALQKFMLDKMKKIKSGKDGEIPLGYDAMKERMLKEANEWADKNMTNGREAIKGYLEGGFKNLFGDDIIKRNFELSSSEAAKLFAGKTDAQNKYLKYLRENELRNRGKKDYKPGIWSDATRDPEKIRENFLRKLRKREEEKAQWDKIRSKEWHPSKKWSQSLKKAIIFSGQSLKDAIGFQVKKPWRELTSSTSNLQAYKDQRDERLALEKEMMSADAERKAVLQRAIEAREKAMLELAAKDAEVAKLREKDAIDALARAKSMLEKEAAKIQEEAKKVDDTVKAIDKILDDKAKSDADKKAEIRTKLEADGLIPTGLKVEFGAKISDVLLVAPDIGLKAGNILLGVPDSRKKEFNEAQVKDLEIRLTQENSKLKISKMNQKLKEFEIQQLEKLDPKDAGLDRLRTELEDLKKEVNKFESNVTDFEKQKVVLSIAS